MEVDTRKGMPVIGKQFRQDRQQVLNALSTLSPEEMAVMESQLKHSGYVTCNQLNTYRTGVSYFCE